MKKGILRTDVTVKEPGFLFPRVLIIVSYLQLVNHAISDTPSRIGLLRPNLAFSSPPPAPWEQTQR